MPNHIQKLVRIPHCRCQWSGSEIVHVCARWGRLKGTDESVKFKSRFEQDYKNAKNNGDFEAAGRITADCVRRNPGVIDEIVDALIPVIERGIPIICAVPHPSFDDDDGGDTEIAQRAVPKNVIPSAYAAYLAEIIGAEMDDEIIERERIGRTKLSKFERFLWQPSFVGRVRTDAVYVLVDDVFTLGGTLAAFRSYIISNGGTVALMTALAHQTGKHQPLALVKETWDELNALLGANFTVFWEEEVGHGANCLTEAEGKVLVEWAKLEVGNPSGVPILQRLRNRLSETAAKNLQSAGARSG